MIWFRCSKSWENHLAKWTMRRTMTNSSKKNCMQVQLVKWRVLFVGNEHSLCNYSLLDHFYLRFSLLSFPQRKKSLSAVKVYECHSFLHDKHTDFYLTWIESTLCRQSRTSSQCVMMVECTTQFCGFMCMFIFFLFSHVVWVYVLKCREICILILISIKDDIPEWQWITWSNHCGTQPKIETRLNKLYESNKKKKIANGWGKQSERTNLK